jgi:hypothetical protein
MEVLSTGFSDDSWIAPILVKVRGNVFPELLEHECASCEMQGSETRVSDCLRYNLRRWPRDKLDDARGNSGFCENLVNEVIGIRSRRRGFPNYDVTDQSGC